MGLSSIADRCVTGDEVVVATRTSSRLRLWWHSCGLQHREGGFGQDHPGLGDVHENVVTQTGADVCQYAGCDAVTGWLPPRCRSREWERRDNVRQPRVTGDC